MFQIQWEKQWEANSINLLNMGFYSPILGKEKGLGILSKLAYEM